MRIVIHGGLHKTASTSFQKICSSARKALEQKQILYPKIKTHPSLFNHNYWLDIAFYDGDYSWCQQTLRQASRIKADIECILLSAENLEYFSCGEFRLSGIRCTSYPRKLEKRLLVAGATSVDWVFVFRDPVEYHASLYSQLSAGCDPDRPIVDFLGSAMVAAKWGGLQLTSFHQNHKFIFDYPAFLKRFTEQVSGRVAAVPFQEMTQGMPGDPLLYFASKGRLTMKELVFGESLDDSVSKANQGRSWKDCEVSYARRFLGNNPNDQEAFEKLVSRMAEIRAHRRGETHTHAKSLLSRRFSNWDDVFSTYPYRNQAS